MSARDVLRSFAESRSADHEPIPARLTYGQVREALRLIEELETRVRPVAEWRAFVLGSDRGKLTSGSVTLGEVNGDGNHWVARCRLTDEIHECANPWAARAWLEERVRAAGFEVSEESSRG